MDYLQLAKTIDEDLLKAVALINNPEIEPEVRQAMLERLFSSVGENVYNVIYDMATFDMDVVGTVGAGIDMNRMYGIAKLASDSVVTGGTAKTTSSINLWLQDTISKATYDAFNVAHDLGKHPTLTRTERSNCCKWCTEHVGTFIDPTSEAFRRHDNCRAKIVVSGYKTRNGLVENYRNPNKKRKGGA